jgi:hypothetical protein
MNLLSRNCLNTEISCGILIKSKNDVHSNEGANRESVLLFIGNTIMRFVANSYSGSHLSWRTVTTSGIDIPTSFCMDYCHLMSFSLNIW